MFDSKPVESVVWDVVIEKISNGEVPSDFCKDWDPAMPESPAAIERRAQQDKGFAVRLEEAKRIGAIVMLAECKSIASNRAYRTDERKLMIDARLKIAAIWNPEKCSAPKHDKDVLPGVHAMLHVPFAALSAEQKAELESYFGF